MKKMIMASIANSEADTIKHVSSKKKSVSFKSTVRVHPVIHANNYTSREIKACWFSKKELSRSQSKARALVKLMKEGEVEDNVEICFRGLEHFAPHKVAAKTERRQASIDKVLEAQAQQMSQDICDEQLIAVAYKEVTEISAMLARVMAAKDALFARRYAQKVPTRRRTFPREKLLDTRNPKRSHSYSTSSANVQ
jgi:hypothetical protein